METSRAADFVRCSSDRADFELLLRRSMRKTGKTQSRNELASMSLDDFLSGAFEKVETLVDGPGGEIIKAASAVILPAVCEIRLGVY